MSKQSSEICKVLRVYKSKSGEKPFIEGIFGNLGVLSALEHDSIVGAQGMSRTEQYAVGVAEAAAKVLRESVAQTQRAPIGTVTWTGKNGSAGREISGVVPRQTASSLLSSMKNKNATNHNTDNGSSSSVSHAPSDSKELIFKLHKFFKDKGGVATTPEIKELAKKLQITESGRLQFRSMLKQIALLNKDRHLWTLKPDYSAS